MASMGESRQQRRARERAKAKAARRSLPPPPEPSPARSAAAAPASRPRGVLEVELTRFCDADVEDGEDPVTWHAEWGLQGDSVGTEDSSTNVSELIDGVVENAAAQWGSQYDPLTIEWELTAGDRLPEGQTIEDIINSLGVTLPRTVPPPPLGSR
jgi:hypothetical protein